MNEEFMNELKNATWFMIVADGRHDIYLNNERDEILEKYKGRAVKRCVGMGNQPYDEADTVKIVL